MKDVVITIGRQFGAGGRELGKRLAEALCIPYYDKELLAMEAKSSGLSQEFLQQQDEKQVNSLLFSLVMGTRNLTGKPTLQEMVDSAQREAILSAAEQGSCVIVGRYADSVLPRERTFRIFVAADEEQRVQRICVRDGIGRQEAKAKMNRIDRSRAYYYEYHTQKKWGYAPSYDLCMNLSKIGMEQAVHMVLERVKAD